MERKLSVLFNVLFFIIISLSNHYAQTVGKVLSKDEAYALFGAVTDSVDMSISDFNSILNQAQNYCMFKISNSGVIILGDGKKLLFPMNIIVNSHDIFSVFSTSKIKELISTGTSGIISFENRKDRLTITYGFSTLDFSMLCPPFCP